MPKSLRLSCGSELTDKEFRYLRTVIVTAAVYGASIRSLAELNDPLKPSSTGQASAPIHHLTV